MEALIIAYGYYIVFIGTFLEGETILILAGFLAHRGYMDFRYVVLFAFLGSLIGDQIYFFIGRYRGSPMLTKHQRWKSKIEVFNRFLRKYNILVILLFRFLYGLRTVAPFAIGMSDVSIQRFILLNAASALLWSVIIGAVGFLFGHAVDHIMGDIKEIEIAVIALLSVIFIFVALYRISGNRKKKIPEDKQ